MRPEEQPSEVTAESQEGQGQGPVFRQDGGAGSVMRERQPGYGGMDALPASEQRGDWQNVTSDRYGHPVPEQKLEAEDVQVVVPEETGE